MSPSVDNAIPVVIIPADDTPFIDRSPVGTLNQSVGLPGIRSATPPDKK